MAAIFWAIAFLPALAAMSYFYWEAKATHGAAQVEALQDGATRIGNQLSQLIADTSRMNAFLALDPELARLLASASKKDTEQVLATLHRVIVANRDVELIMLMDRKGEVVTSTDPDLIGKNFGFRDYFKLGIQGRPHVTGFVVGSVSGNTGVYFSHPITTGNGTVVGAVVTKLLAKAFIAMVEAERRSKAQTAFLVDADGVVVYHPNSDWVNHSIVPLSEKAQEIILTDRRYRLPRVESLDIPTLHDAVTRYPSGGSVRWLSPKTNQYERAGYMQIPAYNWTVIVSSEEQYLALAQQRLERIMAAAVGAAIVSFGLAFVLLRLLLIKPLRGIRAAAQRIVRGEYRDTSAGRIAGELGEIADALNTAAGELHRNRREHESQGRILVPEIRQRLLPKRTEGSNITRMAVVYCALSGIHEMFDRKSARDALATLGDYAEQISEIVKPWGGQINHISGQSIVAVLAATLAEGNLESQAVSAALAIQRRVAELNRARAETNDPVADVAIGVCTAGILVTGATNAFERYLNAMLNDGINVAETLAALSMQSAGRPVMINHTTYVGVRNRADITPTSMGQRKLRGRAEPSEVYSIVFGVPPLAPANILAIAGKIDRADPKPAG
jgi:class 3 adenylate cyclase